MRARRRCDRPECHSAGGWPKSPGESFEKLRRQGDFRHQDQGLAAVLQGLGQGLEIDFGLARAGDALEQDRLERPRRHRRAQVQRRLFLRRREEGRAKIGVGPSAGRFWRQSDGLQRAIVDQRVHHPGRDPGETGKFGLGRGKIADKRRQRARAGGGRALRRARRWRAPRCEGVRLPRLRAARVAMRRTMPRGAMVQAATQSSRARNFPDSGGRSSRSITGLSLSDEPRRKAQTTPICAREPSETLTKSPSARVIPSGTRIGIGLIHRDRDQHIGDVRRSFPAWRSLILSLPAPGEAQSPLFQPRFCQ